jgi:hypothetical protein
MKSASGTPSLLHYGRLDGISDLILDGVLSSLYDDIPRRRRIDRSNISNISKEWNIITTVRSLVF